MTHLLLRHAKISDCNDIMVETRGRLDYRMTTKDLVR